VSEILIRGGCVVDMRPQPVALHGTDVHVVDDRIAAVGRGLTAPGVVLAFGEPADSAFKSLAGQTRRRGPQRPCICAIDASDLPGEFLGLQTVRATGRGAPGDVARVERRAAHAAPLGAPRRAREAEAVRRTGGPANRAGSERDLPAGCPSFMRSVTTWALRSGRTEEDKRATITVTVPAKERPWHKPGRGTTR
jgi:hypothetical protein